MTVKCTRQCDEIRQALQRFSKPQFTAHFIVLFVQIDIQKNAGRCFLYHFDLQYEAVIIYSAYPTRTDIKYIFKTYNSECNHYSYTCAVCGILSHLRHDLHHRKGIAEKAESVYLLNEYT